MTVESFEKLQQSGCGRERFPSPATVSATALRSCSIMLVLVGSAIFASPGYGQELHRLRSQAYRAAADRVAPSIVQIETLGGLERVGRLLIGTGPTTGLIVSEDGLVVSSAFNFIQKPASTLVTLSNGQRYPAEMVARDRSRMLVLLKIAVDEPLPVPDVVERESIQIGQTAIAIGRTYSRDDVNLSTGIVSAVNRIWGRAVQTDANVSPANYGGPLIDLQGRVLGVLAPLSPQSEQEIAGAEWYDSGIGFAVPLADVLTRLEQWRKGEDLVPGKIGVSFEAPGALVAPPQIGVVKLNSPAAEAGLEPGDIVTRFNEVPVNRLAEIRHELGPHYAGDTIELTLRRGDEEIRKTLTLAATIPPYEHAFLGILPAQASTEDADAARGVRVRHVYPDSPAAQMGLEPDDRVTQFEGTDLVDADELRAKLATLSPGNSVTISWLPGGAGEELQEGQATLIALPDELPQSLPQRPERDHAAGDAPGDNQATEVGEVEIKIPEEPNQCTAYVPKRIDQLGQPSLLVLLLPPGQEAKPVIESWKSTCDEYNLVLLIPEAQDPQRWQPTELGFIDKAINQAIERYHVASQRVVVLGRESGGRLGYLLAFRNREQVRGLIIADAAASPGGQPISVENEPLQRLALVLLIRSGAETERDMRQDAETFQELKFPVSVVDIDTETLSDPQRGELARWIDALDRL